MSIWGDLAKNGIEGVARGIGGMAKDVREAVTGKAVLSGDEMIRLQTIAHEMEIAALEADKAAMLGQIEINKLEAQSADFFRGGWRPAVGWVCVLGLFYSFLLCPILPWIFDICGYDAKPLPGINIVDLIGLLAGMLGLGGFRTFEKVKGLK